MAVDLYTKATSSREMSPRISFSHDLKNCEIVPIEPHIPLKTSLLDYDFDFCVSKRSYDQESSLADELFANGVILPIQVKRKDLPTISKSLSLPPLPPLPSEVEVETIKDTKECKNTVSKSENDNSFWKFKRSKSLNCGRIYRKGLCSLPLLSRSKSTGSTASSKRSLIPKEETQHHQQQQTHNNASLKKNSSSTHHQKPPLKKNYIGGSSYNPNLVQLNVPTGKLLGFGSFFSHGKDKVKKK